MKNSFLLLIMLLGQSVYAQINFSPKSIAEAFQQSKATGKPIFVEIYADGCHHCEAFKHTFDSNKSVGLFYNQNFISYQVEVNSEEGRAFRAEQNIYVMSTPLMTFWSADSVLLSIVPAGDEQNTEAGIIKMGQAALTPQGQWPAIKRAFKNGQEDPSFLVNLAYLARYTSDTLLNMAAMNKFGLQQQAKGFPEDNFTVLQKVIIDDEN